MAAFLLGLILGVISLLVFVAYAWSRISKLYKKEQPERHTSLATEYRRFMVWLDARSK